jgi:tripartite-type tricarboxylate transporter receptor subunit TctC
MRLLAVASLASTLMSAALAQNTDFYRNKQMTFIVSTDPGTGFDSSTRLISRFLPKYIPGAPTIVVRNMAGAGGTTAANWLYNIAPKDGLTIGMLQTNMPFNPLYGDTAAQFESQKFNWLGSPSKETALLVVWHTSPFNSIADIGQKEFRLASTGAVSTPAIYARLMAYVLGLNVKIINGYKSQAEEFLAMERGENDGIAAPYWSSIQAEKPDWLRDKKVRILTYWGADAISEIPGPYIFDLIKDPRKIQVLQSAQAGLALGRPIAAPPGISADKLKILRDAFGDVFKDPDYLAECKKEGLECRYPASGDDLLNVIKTAYAQPKPVISAVTSIFTGAAD